MTATNKVRRDALVEDARFSVLQLQQAQRNVLISAKADTVAQKQFEVARNRYIIGKISDHATCTSPKVEKDDAVLVVRAGAARLLDGVLPPAPRDAVRLRRETGIGGNAG